MMKKFNLLFVTILCTIALSCSSDDSNDPPENVSIFGEWKIVSILDGGTEVTLDECDQGGGVIFEEFVANFIVVDNVGLEPDITVEGFEQCDFRSASFGFIFADDTNFFYTIVEGEGSTLGVDDSIITYEIEVLTAQNLRIKSIAFSTIGGIEDIETNSVALAPSEQETLIYRR
ncbi:MAG: hypothetical protein AAGH46_03715 [Bacteroidota bacterium]